MVMFFICSALCQCPSKMLCYSHIFICSAPDHNVPLNGYVFSHMFSPYHNVPLSIYVFCTYIQPPINVRSNSIRSPTITSATEEQLRPKQAVIHSTLQRTSPNPLPAVRTLPAGLKLLHNAERTGSAPDMSVPFSPMPPSERMFVCFLCAFLCVHSVYIFVYPKSPSERMFVCFCVLCLLA